MLERLWVKNPSGKNRGRWGCWLSLPPSFSGIFGKTFHKSSQVAATPLISKSVHNINWNRKKHASRKFQRKTWKVPLSLVHFFFGIWAALFCFLPRWTEPFALPPGYSPLFRSCFKPSVHDMGLILRRLGPTLSWNACAMVHVFVHFFHTHTDNMDTIFTLVGTWIDRPKPNLDTRSHTRLDMDQWSDPMGIESLKHATI